jgi:hypothetical protein
MGFCLSEDSSGEMLSSRSVLQYGQMGFSRLLRSGPVESSRIKRHVLQQPLGDVGQQVAIHAVPVTEEGGAETNRGRNRCS